MTGATRLARTSVLTLLLLGVLSPVPVLGAVLFDNSQADKVWDITLPTSVPLPGATDGHYVNFFKGILSLGNPSPVLGADNVWITTATTTTARIRKAGNYTCDSMLIGTSGFSVNGPTYNINNAGNYPTDSTPPLSVGTEYCDFQFSYGGIPPGTPLSVAFLGTLAPHAVAGSDSNGGASFDGFYGNPIPGGFAFQLCDIDGCSGGFSTTTTPTTTPLGPSSVLFLPGIESSRLYEPRTNCTVTPLTDCVDQLWEPNTDGDVRDLFMNPDGTSVRSDIYTKDVMDSYTGGGNTDIYKTFSNFMDSEVTAHKVAAWSTVPYDWRLGLDTVVNGGVSTSGHISYTDIATSSYMVDQVLALASSSRTHKVTIIGHSNGGLVAKVLMNKLVAMGKGDLIDNIVFVGVPQLGTPKAIPAILHGYDQSKLAGLVVSESSARTLAKNSPGLYTLLPSAGYFDKVVTAPVMIDSNSLTAATLRSYYGQSINSKSMQDAFLLGSLDQRAQPDQYDTDSPIKLSSDLLSQANALHSALDTWTAPQGIRTYEIAGVGIDTPSSVTYKDNCGFFCLLPHIGYEANFVVDGDGTVVGASAQGGVGEKYFFNIPQLKSATGISIDHATLMGATPIISFIGNLLEGTTTLPTFITSTAPSFASTKHLIYRIHSPVSLDLYDSQGHHTGIATMTFPDGTTHSYIENNASGASYDEFGEVKYAFSDDITPLHIVLKGLSSGNVTYDILEMTGNTITATTTFVNIPVATTTRITMDIAGSISNASPLQIDMNGDGIVDKNLHAGGTVFFDTTPPEFTLGFGTTTNALAITAIDDSGYATTSTTTMYPLLKKGQKEYKGTATTTVTARDAAGNSTVLVYTYQLPTKDRRIAITPISISYNGITAQLPNTLLKYKWNKNTNNSYSLLAGYLQTQSTTTEAHFRPKKNFTVIMTKPTDFDDGEDDSDSDVRPVRLKLPGLIVPQLITKAGLLTVSY